MKVLYCAACGDIIAPYPTGHLSNTGKLAAPRKCLCGRHAVWWTTGGPGWLRIFDRERHIREPTVPRTWTFNDAWEPKAFVIGMTNMVLHHKNDMLTGAEYKAICDAHDPYYLFKRDGQWALRIRPGHTSDTAWADPEEYLATSPLTVIDRDAIGPLPRSPTP